MDNKIKKKDLLISICVLFSALVIIMGCSYLVDELGVFFDNTHYIRFIFGLGIVTGFMISLSGRVLAYFLGEIVKWKNKK